MSSLSLSLSLPADDSHNHSHTDHDGHDVHDSGAYGCGVTASAPLLLLYTRRWFISTRISRRL